MAKHPKRLTIKIEQAGKVSYRTLRAKDQLTIGQNPDNDVTLYGDQYPRKHVLFARRDDYYEIRLKRYMDGEVRVGQSRLFFRDLLMHRLLPLKGDSFRYPLTQDKEGYLVIGDAKISFKFDGVSAPVIGNVREYSWFYATFKQLGRDLVFKGLVLLLVIFHAMILRYMQENFSGFVPRINVNRVPERFARFIVKKTPSVEEEKGVITEKRAKAGESAEEEKAKKAKGKAKTEKRTKPSNMGLLGLLGGTGSTAHSSSMIDFLLDKGLVKEIDEVMANSNLRIGKGSSNSDISDVDEWLSLSEVNGGIDDIIGDVGEVESVQLGKKGKVEIERVGAIKGTPGAVGQRSEESVRSVLLAYMGRLKYIYEKYLKRDPSFRGKMVVEVVIQANGRVADVKILSSTMNNRRFETEIVNVIRRWKYEPISEGLVSVTYPLVFNKIE